MRSHVAPSSSDATIAPPGRARQVGGRSRSRWIFMAIAVQAVLLSAGWYLTVRQVRHQAGDAVSEHLTRLSVENAEQLSQTINGMDMSSVAYGNDQWQRLQGVIEGYKLPGDGFACIIDEDGRLLCHPQMRSDPSFRDVLLGDHEFAPSGAPRATTFSATPKYGVLAGTADFIAEGTHYIATTYLPEVNGRLLVHQPESGLARVSDVATGGLSMLAGGIGLTVLLLTGLSTHRLLRRHDRAMDAINEGLEAEVARRVAQATNARDGLITGLAKLADYRDTDTGAHLDRIAEYAALLAQQLAATHPKIDAAWIAMLRIASSMHDIGKVGVEDAVLLKPAKLSPAERKRMERHPSIGTDTLLAVRKQMGDDALINMGIRVTLYHHERWDGKGYPVGLAGEHIPLEARIVALADVYDAMTSQRVYKDARPHAEVVDQLRAAAGTQFDPAVVEAFLAVEAQFDAVRERLQGPADEGPRLAG